MLISNRVICQIRVRIEFKFHNPRLFYGSLFNILYRGTGKKYYCRMRGLYKIHDFTTPFPFLKVHVFFVLRGKYFKCEWRIWSFENKGPYQIKFHNPSSVYFILPRYRNKMLLSIKGPVHNFKISQPIFFTEVHLFLFNVVKV